MEIILALCVVFALGMLVGYFTCKHGHSEESSLGLLHIVKMDDCDEPYMFLELDKSMDEVASKKYATFKVTQK
jgi:hypothetical protein